MFRRFVLFIAIAFSFGGFTFYTSVVVPTGTDVFDATTQGFITRRVTHVLNLSAAITLAILIWELAATYGLRPRWQRVTFIGLLVVYSLCLAALIILHPQLDAMLDIKNQSVNKPEQFYQLHRAYLWVSTIEWLSTIGMIGLICRSAK